MNLHKCRKPLEKIAKEINTILRGIINYYHHFWKDDMRLVLFQLSARLLKCVKWEKDLYKKASVRYLKTRYDEKPSLFAHWLLVYPKIELNLVGFRNMKSRMKGDFHVRFRENAGVKFPCVTRLAEIL